MMVMEQHSMVYRDQGLIGFAYRAGVHQVFILRLSFTSGAGCLSRRNMYCTSLSNGAEHRNFQLDT